MCKGEDFEAFAQRERERASALAVDPGPALRGEYRGARLSLPKSVYAVGERLDAKLDGGTGSIELVSLGDGRVVETDVAAIGTLRAPADPGHYSLELRQRHDSGDAWSPIQLLLQVVVIAAPGALGLAADPRRVPMGSSVELTIDPRGVALFGGAHVQLVENGVPGEDTFREHVHCTITLDPASLEPITIDLPRTVGCFELRLYDRGSQQRRYRLDTLRFHSVAAVVNLTAPLRCTVGSPPRVSWSYEGARPLLPGATLRTRIVPDAVVGLQSDRGWTTSTTVPADADELSLPLGATITPGRIEIELVNGDSWQMPIARADIDVVLQRAPGAIKAPRRIHTTAKLALEIELPPSVWRDRPRLVVTPIVTDAGDAPLRSSRQWEHEIVGATLEISGAEWLNAPGTYELTLLDRPNGWKLDATTIEVVVRRAPGALVAPARIEPGQPLELRVELPDDVWRAEQIAIVVSPTAHGPFHDAPFAGQARAHTIGAQQTTVSLADEWFAVNGSCTLVLLDRVGGWELDRRDVQVGVEWRPQNRVGGAMAHALERIEDKHVGDSLRVTGDWPAMKLQDQARLFFYAIASDGKGGETRRHITWHYAPSTNGAVVDIGTIDTPGVYEVEIWDRYDNANVLALARFSVRVPLPPVSTLDALPDRGLRDEIRVTGRWAELKLFSSARVFLWKVIIDPAGAEQLVYMMWQYAPSSNDAVVSFGAMNQVGTYQVAVYDRYDSAFELWKGRCRIRASASPRDALAPLEDVVLGQSIKLRGQWSTLPLLDQARAFLFEVLRDADGNERREYVTWQYTPAGDELDFGARYLPGHFEVVVWDRYSEAHELWTGRFSISVAPNDATAIDQIPDLLLGQPIRVTGRWSDLHLLDQSRVFLFRIVRDSLGNLRRDYITWHYVSNQPLDMPAQHVPGTYEVVIVDRYSDGYVAWSQQFRVDAAPLAKALAVEAGDARPTSQFRARGDIASIELTAGLTQDHLTTGAHAVVIRPRTWVRGGASVDETQVYSRKLSSLDVAETFDVPGGEFFVSIMDRGATGIELASTTLTIPSEEPAGPQQIEAGFEHEPTVEQIRIIALRDHPDATDDEVTQLIPGATYCVHVEWDGPMPTASMPIEVRVGARQLQLEIERTEVPYLAVSRPFRLEAV